MSEEPSYKKVNYAIRPAKNIERKMMAEAFACLREFHRINSYRYIGFGSTFFTDFSLFHRQLGIKTMVSIEDKIEDADRFKFNRPLGHIDLRFGKSSDVLSTLPWANIPTIIWLDYDTEIDRSKIEDVKYVTANLCTGSMVVITVRAVARDFGDGTSLKERLKHLKEALEDRIPHNLDARELTEKSFSKAVRRIIHANILSVLSDRNAALPTDQKFEYRQLFFFTYDDGTPMVTVGGLVIQNSQSHQFESCGFSYLDFCTGDDVPYDIRTPTLTYKELRNIDTQLPSNRAGSPGVPQDVVDNYRRVYRYFPKFVEAEL